MKILRKILTAAVTAAALAVYLVYRWYRRLAQAPKQDEYRAYAAKHRASRWRAAERSYTTFHGLQVAVRNPH
ncbi:hypothetical protein [Neisseria perflava]|uniref:hypothetical protein n=1 Tax=Neisseria perflava TaxID=33053 RepID=UPI00209CF618|nr:hypothetical protein [Neisseria perflava]MCP1660114.1 hypothetical protein [Neisseria perflava]MCP1772752.1 hypothetical protein [Neisseria perflava]